MAAKKVLQGAVISDKMSETAVVSVTEVKRHRKYKKQYRVSKKFKAHNEKNEFHTGDVVEISETKPVSKEKKWRIIRKVK